MKIKTKTCIVYIKLEAVSKEITFMSITNQSYIRQSILKWLTASDSGRSWLCHLPEMWSWTDFLSLSFLIWEGLHRIVVKTK